MNLLLALFVTSVISSKFTEGQRECSETMHNVEELVRNWAPLVWLAPGERYFPSSVPEFLRHVTPYRDGAQSTELPGGQSSETWYLVTKQSIDSLLRDSTSFLHGTNPARTAVPVYALVTACHNGSALFQATYWMFYPYSQGKPLCMADTGVFGTWPVPAIKGQCLGKVREYGSHVGDWEHVSLKFQGRGHPAAMYVSTHDAGAYYTYNAATRNFEYESHEVRKGVLQRPAFPIRGNVTTLGGHPILFAARGSHGLWTASGRHKYVKVPGLHDDTGYGVPWPTWERVQVIHDPKDCSSSHKMLPAWMDFRGRWGNPKNKCHPVTRLGLSACQYFDGPTGIPMKKRNFKCPLD